MMNKFEEIKNEYASKFHEHGVSSASMLMPKGRHEARFAIVAEYLQKYENPTILDYGCGLGFLYDYLNDEDIDVNYLGIDMTATFISSCIERVKEPSRFMVIDPLETIKEEFDVVYASGVFNLQTSSVSSESLEYVKNRIIELFNITKKVMIVDFLSPNVDFEQPGAQHIDYQMVIDWLIPTTVRRWILRHDYLPYEYSIVLFRDDEIIRPENIFRPH